MKLWQCKFKVNSVDKNYRTYLFIVKDNMVMSNDRNFDSWETIQELYEYVNRADFRLVSTYGLPVGEKNFDSKYYELILEFESFETIKNIKTIHPELFI